jgi:uncharacterized membrane protein YeiH
VITALGGGILRDLVLGDTPPPAFTRWGYLFGRGVIPREPPALVRPHSELYAVPAVAGAVAVAIAWELNAYDPVLGAIAAATVFGIRGLALRRDWHGPRAWRR